MVRLIAVPATATLANNVMAMADAYLPEQWTAGTTIAMQDISAGAMAGVYLMGVLNAVTIAAAPASSAAATISACRNVRWIAEMAATAQAVLGAR